MPRLCSSRSLLLSLLIASSASAVSMDWTPIGDPGNACDPQSPGCFGAVDYSYSIAAYEVTNAQYVEFLNAKAVSDPLGLYNANMGNGAASPYYGGISRSGSSGAYTYSVVSGRENMPVNYVSYYDALRFANWMNNGQGEGDTESGAYTITIEGINDNTISRNSSATIFLTSEDEWYKAAYYDAASSSYFIYPTASDVPTACAAPTAAPNHANCGGALGDLTTVGSYPGSASPYGTLDQAGNVWEWTEGITGGGAERVIRGGGSGDASFQFASWARWNLFPGFSGPMEGFRLVMIPEPGTGLLVTLGLLSLAGWRWARFSHLLTEP
jgi:formylglycine-generating enzyme required for sulfatase activity